MLKEFALSSLIFATGISAGENITVFDSVNSSRELMLSNDNGESALKLAGLLDIMDKESRTNQQGLHLDQVWVGLDLSAGLGLGPLLKLKFTPGVFLIYKPKVGGAQ